MIVIFSRDSNATVNRFSTFTVTPTPHSDTHTNDSNSNKKGEKRLLTVTSLALLGKPPNEVTALVAPRRVVQLARHKLMPSTCPTLLHRRHLNVLREWLPYSLAIIQAAGPWCRAPFPFPGQNPLDDTLVVALKVGLDFAELSSYHIQYSLWAVVVFWAISCSHRVGRGHYISGHFLILVLVVVTLDSKWSWKYYYNCTANLCCTGIWIAKNSACWSVRIVNMDVTTKW